MEFRVEGIDELRENLRNLSGRAKEIEGEREVKLSELFTDLFMKKYTDYGTLEDFAENCEKLLGADFSSIVSIDKYKEKLNHFIKERTSFDNWDKMIGKATEEWVGKKLQLI